jgi:hypothetical protein
MSSSTSECFFTILQATAQALSTEYRTKDASRLRRILHDPFLDRQESQGLKAVPETPLADRQMHLQDSPAFELSAVCRGNHQHIFSSTL